jgi:FKBP-type peptidyl-prolyl cis-trans isomerase
MKKYCFFVLTFLAMVAHAQDKPDLTGHNQRINYAFGMDVVSTFQHENFNIDVNAFIAGMEDSLAGKPALTPEQKKAAIQQLQLYLQAQAIAMRKVAAVKDLKEGEAFLKNNVTKDGVKIKEITAPDGSKAKLQYKIIKSGPDGPSPKKGDIVEVHYVGSLIDGTVFDNSIQRGFPATFGITDVIPGWTAALQMMKVGDKWELFIPPKLAYGEFGPPQIPPNSVLIFQLQLLSFYTPPPATNAPATSGK